MTDAKPISFARGAPSLDIVDVEGLKAAAQAAFAADPGGLTAYGTSVGYLPLREWIADKHGVAPEQVIVTNGSMQADAFLFDALVAAATPSSSSCRPTTARCCRCATAGPTCAWSSSSPTGSTWRRWSACWSPGRGRSSPTSSRTSRTRPVTRSRSPSASGCWSWPRAQLHGVRGRPLRGSALRRVSGCRRWSRWTPENVVYASSFSKTVAPGIRVGYLVGPRPVIARIEQLATNTYISPNMVAQGIVNQFARSGALERSIETVKDALRERVGALCGGAARASFPRPASSTPEGGYFMWVELPRGHRRRRAVRGRRGARGPVRQGHRFRARGHESSLRLAYSGVTPAEIEEGVSRLAEAYREISAGGRRVVPGRTTLLSLSSAAAQRP